MLAPAALNDEVRLFVVHALACYDTPTVVAKAVKDEFGIDVSRQAVQAYDPTKHAGRDLGDKWRAIFEATRAAFVAETADIPISVRSSRLRRLQRMADKAEEMRNYALAAALLEQAAKECGGAFTNRRELTGKDGSPIETDTTLRIEFVKAGKPGNGADADNPDPGGV